MLHNKQILKRQKKIKIRRSLKLKNMTMPDQKKLRNKIQKLKSKIKKQRKNKEKLRSKMEKQEKKEEKTNKIVLSFDSSLNCK